MATTTLPTFLRGRRERLAPQTTQRRRTPGLRREEVAARAGVSVTWYTWLEQGRGGMPSDDVDANREVLLLLAQDRPPPRKPARPVAVTPALQRVLDSGLSMFVWSPANEASARAVAQLLERSGT